MFLRKNKRENDAQQYPSDTELLYENLNRTWKVVTEYTISQEFLNIPEEIGKILEEFSVEQGGLDVENGAFMDRFIDAKAVEAITAINLQATEKAASVEQLIAWRNRDVIVLDKEIARLQGSIEQLDGELAKLEQKIGEVNSF